MTGCEIVCQGCGLTGGVRNVKGSLSYWCEACGTLMHFWQPPDKMFESHPRPDEVHEPSLLTAQKVTTSLNKRSSNE